MGSGSFKCAGAVITLLVVASPAHAQEDDWYYRQPGPALPQQLNGVIRPDAGGRAPERLDTVQDVFTLIRACWRQAPRTLTRSGQQLTVRVSFNRRGEVIGEPRITFYRAGTDPNARDAFENSIRTAFRLCVPLPFTEGLGAAVAGRPFTFRFIEARSPNRSP